jgi:S1-C subfamily serine protease
VSVLRLRSVTGSRRGREFVFSGPRVRIGRSRDNDLILPDRELPVSSGHHAEALLDASGTWWIVDVGSVNGTRVNDVDVTRHELKTGDRLTMGADEFAVAIGPARRWPIGAAIVVAVAAIGIALMALAIRDRARPAFEDVAVSAARSVFLIAFEQDGTRGIVGTGFAVADAGWLATNAHVADALQAANGRHAVAIQGDTYEPRRIAAVRIHPGWKPGSIQDDVALLKLEPAVPFHPLPLAADAAIARLRRGTPVAAFGFPAASTNALRPRGRLSVDVVGDVRGEYLEVGLGIAPGTSGSPVFDEAGLVVAIVAGGDFVSSPGVGAQPSGSSANWALSARLIRELLGR